MSDPPADANFRYMMDAKLLQKRVLTLPPDMQWVIYRRYFSLYVVPVLSQKQNKCNMINEPVDSSMELNPFEADRGTMLSAFSKVCLYGRYGAEVDITELSANDRYYVCRELENAGGQLVVQGVVSQPQGRIRPKGRIVILTPDWGRDSCWGPRANHALRPHMKIYKTECIVPGLLHVTRYGLLYNTANGENRDVPVAYQS